MICKLAFVGLLDGQVCEGALNKSGKCGVFSDLAVAKKMEHGACVFKDIRMPKIGIYAPVAEKQMNALKASKKAASGK